MTLRKKPIENEDTDVNLTPMLDVTFILLIFFIVTSTFVKIPGVQVKKIDADNSVAIKAPIVVALDANSDVWIDRKKMQPREVYAIMQEMIEDNPGAKAMIQVDSDSRNGPLIDLMQSMTDAGMIRIDVVTTPRNER